MRHSSDITNYDLEDPLLPEHDEKNEIVPVLLAPPPTPPPLPLRRRRQRPVTLRPIMRDCIFRVPDWLRKTNPKAYTPTRISIGPYHKATLVEKEYIKKKRNKYLKSFLLQLGIHEASKNDKSCDNMEVDKIIEKGMEMAMNEMKKLKDSAKACYKDRSKVVKNEDEFMEMLLADGCFVVMFLSKNVNGKEREDQVFLSETRRDIFLMENQLPFSVLSMIYHMWKTGSTDNNPTILRMFHRVIKCNYRWFVPKTTPKHLYNENSSRAIEIQHLLQVVGSMCIPPADPDNQTHSSSPSKGRRRVKNPMRPCAGSGLDDNNQPHYSSKYSELEGEELSDDPTLELLNGATNLKEDGISFENIGQFYKSLDIDITRDCPKNIDKLDSTTLFDIKLQGDILQIPRFKVDDNTETFFRNMIAFEQCSPPGKCRPKVKYYTDYAFLMFQLLGSDKDVYLLRRKWILQNLLRDDRQVYTAFNELAATSFVSNNFYYAKLCADVRGSCKRIAIMRKYIYTPWGYLFGSLGYVSAAIGIFISLKALFPS